MWRLKVPGISAVRIYGLTKLVLITCCISLIACSFSILERQVSPREVLASHKSEMSSSGAAKIINANWQHHLDGVTKPMPLGPNVSAGVLVDDKGFRWRYYSKSTSYSVQGTATSTTNQDFYVYWGKVTSIEITEVKHVRGEQASSGYSAVLKFSTKVNNEPTERPMQLVVGLDPKTAPYPLDSFIKALTVLVGAERMPEPDQKQKEFKKTW